MDFGIDTKPKEGIGTENSPRLSVNLGAMTKPFKLGGTLANPSRKTSTVQAAKTEDAAIVGPAGWPYLFMSGSSGIKNACAEA